MASKAKVAVLAVAAIAALPGCGGNDGKVSGPSPSAPETLTVGAPWAGKSIPKQYTCDGAGEAPSLTVSGVPKKAKALALLVEDPDAPGGTYVHWALFNIDPKTETIDDNLSPEPLSGRNSAGGKGYEPICPPEGGALHRYLFSVYALKTPLKLGEGADPAIVRQGIRDQATAKGVVTATSGR